jgi:hypothetical protein
MRIALIRPASSLGVVVWRLNEIGNPSRVIWIADVENLQPGVEEGDDKELAVIGSKNPPRHLMVPKRAPLAQKSPGNGPTVAVEIGHGASSLLISMILGFFHFCGAQSFAVCSERLIARSKLTGAPVRKFCCS